VSELIWIFPILVSVALVLGACRGRDMGKILREASLSFIRLTVGIAIVCAVLQLFLLLVVRVL
jgi:hypothetical protein